MKKHIFASACALALSMTAASAQVGGGAGSPPSAQSGGTVQNPQTAKDAAPHKGTTGASKNSDGSLTPGNGKPTTVSPNAAGSTSK